MRARADWHRDFFRNSFYNPAAGEAARRAPAEASFVLRRLKLKRGSALLDLCCGPGRHAVEFAKKGLAVTGYDLSGEYLREAAARAKKARVALRLARGDMRELKFSGEFDAAVNLFTSFGYFLKFSDDLRTLKGVSRALKPGGFFLIELVNAEHARKSFRPRWWDDMGDHFLLISSELTADGLHETWMRLPKRGGRARARTFFCRLYDRKRLSGTLAQAGLKPLKFWGGYGGAPLSARHSSLICLAIKK